MCSLRFLLCSFYLDILRAQRIIGFYPQINGVGESDHMVRYVLLTILETNSQRSAVRGERDTPRRLLQLAYVLHTVRSQVPDPHGLVIAHSRHHILCRVRGQAPDFSLEMTLTEEKS